MSQVTVNEFRMDKNPGGRMHDDFNGLANKDIYAENFTDLDTGAPVFVRVKLLEYMETGEEAGVNRKTDGGENVPMAERKVKPLIEGADINDTATWYVHKPDTAEETDPFHEYWTWTQEGSTVYMPTFNKNKDSLSVDVNGTYVGADGDFETGTPYDDYVTYTDKQESEELPAYYDADGNDVDEYVKDVSPAPGAGGVKKDPANPDQDPKPNYEEKKEKHTAHPTLAGLGVITMEEWLEKKPVCNKWVWDEDGWFYWPEPVMPQTATGLLLDKVSQSRAPNEKCYYAIELVGQFASTDKDWGTPAVTEKNDDGSDKLGEDGKPIITEAATGFYIDGFTDNAKALLEQASQVIVVKGEGDAPDKWYLPIEANVFKRIIDDEGTFSDPICAGEDKNPGTADDREDVIHVEGEGVKVGETNYGNWFLAPTTAQPYYRTVGSDGKLGTADDARLWTTGGNTFPAGVVDEVADTVTVTFPEDVAELEPGKIEMEVGTTLAKPFRASVLLNDAAAESQEVLWSVASGNGDELVGSTAIGANTGILTVDTDETATELIITAKSKLDDRVFGTYRVRVYGKPNVKLIDVSTGKRLESIQAGTPVKVKAWFYRGEEQMDAALQPTEFTWGEASITARAIDLEACTLEPDPEDPKQATITVGRGTSGQYILFTVGCDKVDPPTEFDIPITAPELITVSVTGEKTALEAGQSVNFTAAFSKPGVLNDETVDWKALGVDGSELTDGLELTPGESGNTLTVKVLDTFVLDENTATITVRAIPKDTTVNAAAAGETTFTVIPPSSITVTPESGEVTIGGTLSLSASVLNADDLPYTAGNVSWFAGDANGQVISGVSIDQNGLLSVAKGVAMNTQITVTAASTVKSDVSKSVVVTADIAVYYDEIPYYVLYTDTANNRQLIQTKNIIGTSPFRAGGRNLAGGVYWPDSDMRTYLLTWLETKPQLKAALWKDSRTDQYATFYTRKGVTSTEYFESNDPLFLLSIADVTGAYSPATVPAEVRDFTVAKDGAGVKLENPAGTWNSCITTDEGVTVESIWALRSPSESSGVNNIHVMLLGGRTRAVVVTSDFAVRPACWVKIK